MTADYLAVERRPTPVAGGLAVVVAAAVVATLAPGGTARLGLVVELAGVGVLAGGYALYRRDWRVAGVVVAVAGLCVWAGGIVAVASALDVPSLLIEVLPGAVGLLVLALGVVPYRGVGSRGAVKAGTALVFVSVVASGLFRGSTLQTLLVAGVGTVVAWDAGEHAIGAGEHLGRRARTVRLDAVHVAGSLLVGAVAVAAGRFVSDLGSPGGSLTSLALLLVAVILLSAALHG